MIYIVQIECCSEFYPVWKTSRNYGADAVRLKVILGNCCRKLTGLFCVLATVLHLKFCFHLLRCILYFFMIIFLFIILHNNFQVKNGLERCEKSKVHSAVRQYLF